MNLASFHCWCLQFETISVQFRVFYAVPHQKVRKMKLSHALSRFKKKKKIKIKKLTNLIYAWHVYQNEKFRCPVNDVILKRGKELVKTVLVTLLAESPLLKSLQNQRHVWKCVLNNFVFMEDSIKYMEMDSYCLKLPRRIMTWCQNHFDVITILIIWRQVDREEKGGG